MKFMFPEPRGNKKKKTKGKGSDFGFERQLPGLEGLRGMQGYLPKSHLEPVPPLTKPWCFLACNICEKKVRLSKIRVSIRRGLVTPCAFHPDGPGVFCEWCQLGLCFGEQIQSMLPTAPTTPGLEVSGERSPPMPHQPVISLANSHHSTDRLAAAFADSSIKVSSLSSSHFPSVCSGYQSHGASVTKAIKSPHKAWLVLSWVCIWTGDPQ